jgi:hypothetical protein
MDLDLLLLARASPYVWIVLLVCLLPVCYAIYYGVQSMAQAKLLRREAPLGELSRHVNQAIAVCGTPRRAQETGDPIQDAIVWRKTTTQRYHSGWGGGQRGWRTVDTKEEAYDVLLQDPSGEALVRVNPTEVHGADSGRGGQYATGGGFLGMGSSEYRELQSTIYTRGTLTVVGRVTQRIDGTLVISRDDEVGQLLSTRAPSTQASAEAAKAWASFLIVPGAWLAGLGWTIFQ